MENEVLQTIWDEIPAEAGLAHPQTPAIGCLTPPPSASIFCGWLGARWGR
ncbi:MAG: hypothetical protein AAFY57_09745 [Cyanobacteria bacterium J06642_2]